jgi:hypothetical protein
MKVEVYSITYRIPLTDAKQAKLDRNWTDDDPLHILRRKWMSRWAALLLSMHQKDSHPEQQKKSVHFPPFYSSSNTYHPTKRP